MAPGDTGAHQEATPPNRRGTLNADPGRDTGTALVPRTPDDPQRGLIPGRAGKSQQNPGAPRPSGDTHPREPSPPGGGQRRCLRRGAVPPWPRPRVPLPWRLGGPGLAAVEPRGERLGVGDPLAAMGTNAPARREPLARGPHVSQRFRPPPAGVPRGEGSAERAEDRLRACPPSGGCRREPWGRRCSPSPCPGRGQPGGGGQGGPRRVASPGRELPARWARVSRQVPSPGRARDRSLSLRFSSRYAGFAAVPANVLGV